jgi:hypothetical protein
MAHASLLDLADIIGIPADQIGIKGRLALAFGARGSGGKNAGAAHYEPSRRVINLTKIMGNGTLAHEYGHFLDHAISIAYMPAKGKTVFASGGKGTGIPHDIQSAMNRVMNTIKTQDVPPEKVKANRERKALLRDQLGKKRAAVEAARSKVRYESKRTALGSETTLVQDDNYRAYDELRTDYNKMVTEINTIPTSSRADSEYYAEAKMNGKYWANDQELFARAFESYVESKMIDKGQRSSYLVDGTKYDDPGVYLKHGSPHRVRINQAIDKLLGVLRSADQFRKAMAGAWLDSLLKANEPRLVL